MGIPLSLLDQTATVKHYAVTKDPKGFPVRGAQTTNTYRCRLDQRATVEEEGRSARVTSLKLLILPPGAVIAPDDEVTVAGITYQVMGEPTRHRAFGTEHHVEADLRSVRDAGEV